MGSRLLENVACLGLAGALGLSGCAATQPRTYYNVGQGIDQEPYIATLARDFQDKAAEARQAEPIASGPAASEFLDAGMALTDVLCLGYFNQAISNHQHRGFAKTMLNDANGLVSAIMGLTQAGSLATGAVGASFSFANSTAENVESSYMVSVDMASAQALTRQVMQKLAANNAEHPPTSYYDAERKLARYASVCTFTGIHDLIAQSVGASSVEVDESGVVTFVNAANTP